jgi:hypothetical protein
MKTLPAYSFDRLLAQFHQNQNDAARKAEVFFTRQIQQELKCTWGEAMRIASQKDRR